MAELGLEWGASLYANCCSWQPTQLSVEMSAQTAHWVWHGWLCRPWAYGLPAPCPLPQHSPMPPPLLLPCSAPLDPDLSWPISYSAAGRGGQPEEWDEEDTLLASMRMPGPQEVFRFVCSHSPEDERDLLPGLCLLTELWLSKVSVWGGGGVAYEHCSCPAAKHARALVLSAPCGRAQNSLTC